MTRTPALADLIKVNRLEKSLSRDEKDPGFTLTEISEMTGVPYSYIEDLVKDAKVGQWLNGRIIVRYSALIGLARKHNWLNQ